MGSAIVRPSVRKMDSGFWSQGRGKYSCNLYSLFNFRDKFRVKGRSRLEMDVASVALDEFNFLRTTHFGQLERWERTRFSSTVRNTDGQSIQFCFTGIYDHNKTVQDRGFDLN